MTDKFERIRIVDWKKYLAPQALPATGDKTYKAGEVWSVAVPGSEPYVIKILQRDSSMGRYFVCNVVAGEADIRFISDQSRAADYSVRVFDPESATFPDPEEIWDEVFSVRKVVDVACTAVAPLPNWIDVVQRIMTKARKHYDEGRTGNFSQVLVPMEDYRSLQDHFVTKDEVFVQTCLGPIFVYPINPDGVTFVD